VSRPRRKARAALGLPALGWAAVALLSLFGLVACGGGGGGGGPTQPPPPPPPTPGITFTPSGAAGANSISLERGAASTTTKLFLEVRANQVQNLYGVAFDLGYPNAVLRFDGAVQGTFLDGTIALSNTPTGNLIVGITRLGARPGVDGSGLLVTLEFTAIATGNGSFAFARNSALDSRGAALAGTSWMAGSVQVVQ
jgi:hypothetical protein